MLREFYSVALKSSAPTSTKSESGQDQEQYTTTNDREGPFWSVPVKLRHKPCGNKPEEREGVSKHQRENERGGASAKFFIMLVTADEEYTYRFAMLVVFVF